METKTCKDAKCAGKTILPPASTYHPSTPGYGDSTNDMELVRLWIADATPDELRTLRAIINGKLGKRQITKEQQAAMQAARKANASKPRPRKKPQEDAESAG